MQRRIFLKGLTIGFLQSVFWKYASLAATAGRTLIQRVRPSDAAWPSASSWQELQRAVGGNLIKVRSLLGVCESDPSAPACADALKNIRNPYYLGDQPGGTQMSGWFEAWTPAPSAYAIAARNISDVVAGVNFARKNNLRLVIKGGGHSYQGTSNAPDSLLLWTRSMNRIALHDAFKAQDCNGSAVPAVTVEAGAVWMEVYDAVTTKAGRYVQGGGCATVGVAGLIQSGGFGSFSKMFGLASAGLLEAEVVTADGKVRIVNPCRDPDLFWGLKGGGGGTFAAVTKVTLRTHKLPETFGDVSVTIQAKSDAAFRRLIGDFLRFYRDELFNSHWGEIAKFSRGNALAINMVFAGLNKETADGLWRRFLDRLTKRSDELTIASPYAFEIMPAQKWWDIDYLQKYSVGSVMLDDRPGALKSHAWWTGDGEQAGRITYGYQSAWLQTPLLQEDKREQLADAIFASSRHWSVSLHFNKGLAGAPPKAIAASKQTAINPAVADAFALAIIAGSGPSVYPGLPGSSLDVAAGRNNASAIAQAMTELNKVNTSGSYLAEGDYFDHAWQNSFWGDNYPRLRALKQKFDPDGLFFVHHGIGSEDWSADGFTQLKKN